MVYFENDNFVECSSLLSTLKWKNTSEIDFGKCDRFFVNNFPLPLPLLFLKLWFIRYSATFGRFKMTKYHQFKNLDAWLRSMSVFHLSFPPPPPLQLIRVCIVLRRKVGVFEGCVRLMCRYRWINFHKIAKNRHVENVVTVLPHGWIKISSKKLFVLMYY